MKKEKPQLDFAQAIREANELQKIGKITEDQYRWGATLLARALKKPETLTGTEAMIAREVARKIFAIFAIGKELRRLEAEFDELLAENDKERLAGQQSQEPPPQTPIGQNPDTPPQDPANQNPDPPITDKTP